ncbi:antitoxin of toxin-antitoxin stability system [Lysobacteraceae bacterium NML95-0200]|nr:antitoxin of toxin-antitoxin stability system [Xanthomonadaceae bacterium NML95-0200]
MSKEAVFTLKLESQLRAEFMAEAAREDRPASQVMRELMRAYIEQQQQARQYDAYLHDKVTQARRSLRAGRGRSHDAVEAAMAARQQAQKRV